MCRPNGLLFHQILRHGSKFGQKKKKKKNHYFTKIYKKIVKSTVFVVKKPSETGLDLHKLKQKNKTKQTNKQTNKQTKKKKKKNVISRF